VNRACRSTTDHGRRASPPDCAETTLAEEICIETV
jgi:hypothetical protein